MRTEADAPAAPETVGRGSIDRADLTPIIKIRPVLTKKRQKHTVKLVKFKQPGEMVIRGAPSHARSGCFIFERGLHIFIHWTHRLRAGM